MLTVATTAMAGGILTNTNQSIDFLRNPARDAAIGLDGVYSNPAGVAFMPEGFHLGINWQYAHQTRTINSTNPVFMLGKKNMGQASKIYEGVADAPFIPSLQAAYNKDKWSIQFNFSVPGGGGKCEYDNGLGSFEGAVGAIAAGLSQLPDPLKVTRYDMDGFMEGRQYYFGFQLGAAYKIYDNLSVYGGLRLLYGNATYRARISNIMVETNGVWEDFGSYLEKAAEAVPSLNTYQMYSNGVNLLCNQSGVGVAPIFGIDYKIGRFNFAAKYEFRTPVHMKNESTVNTITTLAAVNKYHDGAEVPEDAPALLTVGAQWSPIDQVRLNAGWHYFFDKDASWYNDAQRELSHNSYEFLAGAEWDVSDRLTVSCGAQLTRYGNTDEYINDMSFVVNSYSIGLGLNYKVTDKVKVKAAYFQTTYTDYSRYQTSELTGLPVSDTFTRSNRVIGIGCDIDF